MKPQESINTRLAWKSVPQSAKIHFDLQKAGRVDGLPPDGIAWSGIRWRHGYLPLPIAYTIRHIENTFLVRTGVTVHPHHACHRGASVYLLCRTFPRSSRWCVCVGCCRPLVHVSPIPSLWAGFIRWSPAIRLSRSHLNGGKGAPLEDRASGRNGIARATLNT